MTFHDAVTRLISSSTRLSAEERRQSADDLLREYAASLDYESGEVVADIERLTNYILANELQSNNKRGSDTPVYTDNQLAANARRLGVMVPLSEANDLTESDAEDNAIYGKPSKSHPRKVNELKRRVREAVLANPYASNRAIARELGISHTLVARYRKRS